MQEMVLTSPKSAHNSMKEQFESVSSYIVDYLWDQPAIYCGTYKKYNEGSLFGAWLDLRTFDSYEEFIDVCKQLHADEEDPELMFQDYQLYPIFHSISWSEDFSLCEANCVYFAQWSRLSLNTFSIMFVSISFVLSTAVTMHCTSLWFSSDSPIMHLLESSPAPKDVFPLPLEANADA